MRLLLINPKCPESFWSFKWAVQDVLPGTRALNPPLGLATLAALCPPDWDVEIVDENVESVPLDPDADIVGVCGMGVQFPRQCELLTYYRSRGHFVVAGGSYASLCPEIFAPLADTVVAGEAEYVWPEFCGDFERGVHRSPLSGNRDGGAGRFAGAPLRPAAARPVFQRHPAVLARMPVPLRILRHHRHVRPPAAYERPGADRA